MRLVTDPQRVIAHVVALRAEEEKPADAVAAEAAAPAEPEVIKKGKKEAEEGEEGGGRREGGEAREDQEVDGSDVCLPEMRCSRGRDVDEVGAERW